MEHFSKHLNDTEGLYCADIRYFYLKWIIFIFSMVFILSQLDIYGESYGILKL